jgi:hypothetical protein
MIDLEAERLHSLNEARRWFPRLGRGKRPALQTLYRWSGAGYHGVVLETWQVGSTRCTSKQACARFIERVSGLSPRVEGTPTPSLTKTTPQIAKALEESGFDRSPRSGGGRARGAGKGHP